MFSDNCIGVIPDKIRVGLKYGYYSIGIIGCRISRIIRSCWLCGGHAVGVCWSSTGGPAKYYLCSGSMIGHVPIILFIPLACFVVAWLVIVIVWLCGGRMVVLFWLRTVVHVLVK